MLAAGEGIVDLRATSGHQKRALEVKSFSHELSTRACGGGGPSGMRGRMLRCGEPLGTTPEEFISAIRTKFTRLKEEVDAELGVFAGDLVVALAREDDYQQTDESRVTMEDLLVVARQCAEMSAEEF
jgi:hypothetical protein